MMHHLTHSGADTTRSKEDDDGNNKNERKIHRNNPNQQQHQPPSLPSPSSSSPQQKQEKEQKLANNHPNHRSPTNNNRIQQLEYQYQYQQQLFLLLQQKQQQQHNQQIIQQQQQLRHPYPPLSLSPSLYSSTLDKNTSGGTQNPIVGVANIGATTHSKNRIGPPLPTSPGLRSPTTTNNNNNFLCRQQQQQYNNTIVPLPPTYSSSSSSSPTIVTPPIYNNNNLNAVGSASQQQQQSPPPSSPCWIHTVSSMIQHAHAQRNSNNNHKAFLLLQSLQVVAVNMTRKSMTQPWGLGFVSTMQNTTTTTNNTSGSGHDGVASACDLHHYNHRRVIITSSPSSSSSLSTSTSIKNKNKNMTTTGNNNDDTASNNNNNNNKEEGAGTTHSNNSSNSSVHVSYSWTRTIVPYQYPVHRNDIIIDRDDTTTIHTNGGTLNKGTNYSEQLQRALSITTTTNDNDDSDSRNDGIRPGDILVAIDGRSIFDFDFTMNNNNNNNNNMTQMTSYLKSSQSVCLVVLRHPEVVAVNMNARVTAPKIVYDPIGISSRANTIWNQLLILPTMTASSLSLSLSLSLSVVPPHILLLPPIPTESKTTFQQWIGVRKRAWRRRYIDQVYKYKFDISNKIVKKKKREKVKKKQKRHSGSGYHNSNCNSNIEEYDHVHNNTDCDCDHTHNSNSFHYPENSDFWTQQGFGSFQEWISSRTKTWTRSYQWNQQKRQQIEQDCCGEKVVSLPWTIHTTTTHAHSNKNMKTASTTTLHHHTGTQNAKKRAPISSFLITRPCTKRTRDHYHSSSSDTVGQGHGQDDNNDNNDEGGCSTEVFQQWLNIRRYQWRMLRRRRKRQKQQHVGADANTNTDDDTTLTTTPTKSCTTSTDDTVAVAVVSDHTKLSPSSSLNESLCRSDSMTSSSEQGGGGGGGSSSNFPPVCKRKLQLLLSKEDQEMAFMDEILDEQEKEREEKKRRRSERPPLDITRFLDASCGIPDDVIVHCFSYLHAEQEHGKMFAISKHITKVLQERHMVWKQLCPTHWILPRRPRKPWHMLYLTRLRQEQERQQKRWDDLLLKCSTLLFKRDDLQKLEKLVIKAEQDFEFDINYSSGVVCERNSLLNLAVIHKRHKIVRWLVDRPPTTTTTTQCSSRKESPPGTRRRRQRRRRRTADIETYDRGNFTPLLNAAWNGDRFLVRFFLQRQSNRNVRGTQHYTKGIAPPGFQGRTAAQWADQRGFPEVAKLIRLGL